MKLSVLFATAALAIAGLTGAVTAKTVAFEFVADGSAPDGYGPAGEPAPGGMMYGRFQWETSTPDWWDTVAVTQKSADTIGRYLSNASLSFRIEGGPQDGSSFKSPRSYGVLVEHSYGSDGLVVDRLIRVIDAPGAFCGCNFLEFYRTVDTVNDAIPGSGAELSLNDWEAFVVTSNTSLGFPDFGYRFYGLTSLTEVAPAAVPLPATLPLAVIALGALGGFARRGRGAKTAREHAT